MRFLAGILATLIILALAAFLIPYFGLFPATADQPYLPMEEYLAKRDVNQQIRRNMPRPPYPYGPPTDDVLAHGARLYMDNCSSCHGSGSGSETPTAKGMYIKPPQFPKHGVDDDPEGETYYKIEHGYRFTGMPTYKGHLTEEQIWDITYFLKRPAEQLPAAAKAVWDRKAAQG